METEKVAKAIAYLRKRAGYTQKDLANRLGISDKAVSKWERGLGLPDVSLLGKLSILLDTDTDSMLAGDVIHHDQGWHGLVVLEDNPCGIGADTIVYDKPLVYYLLSYFLLVGIKTIHMICAARSEQFVREALLNENPLNIEISFSRDLNSAAQNERFMQCDNLMVVFGRSLIYGVDQTRFFQKAMVHRDHLTILTLPKGNREGASFLRFDNNRKIVSPEHMEKLNTQYNYCDIPVLFCPKSLFLQTFGPDRERERLVTDLFQNQDVYIEPLDRGFVEIRMDDWSAVAEASDFVKIVQEHCGMIIYCIEEVAWRRGMISQNALRARGEAHKGTAYGEYVIGLCR